MGTRHQQGVRRPVAALAAAAGVAATGTRRSSSPATAGAWRGWQREAARARPPSAVRFLGFTPKVRDVLAAGGSAGQPGALRGLRPQRPRSAVLRAAGDGDAHRRASSSGSTTAMAEALLPEDVTAAASRGSVARVARATCHGWRARRPRPCARMRSRSWADMAAEIVDACAGSPAAGLPAMTRTQRFLSGFVTGYAHLILATIAGPVADAVLPVAIWVRAPTACGWSARRSSPTCC